MNSGGKEGKSRKNSKASVLISVGIALFALAAELVPECMEVLKQWRNGTYSVDSGEIVEVRVQVVPMRILQVTEGMKYCKVTMKRRNMLLYPRAREALYLIFYDADEEFIQPVSETEAVQEEPEGQGAEYMLWRAAQEFLPAWMEYEMEYFIEVPEDTDVLYYTSYVPEEQEFEVEIEE